MGASGLGSLLVKEGFLTEQDRLTITKTCGQGSWAFAKSILAIGLLDEDELAAFFAERTRYQIAPKDFLNHLDPSAIQSLDKRLVSKLEVIPLKKDPGKITVGVVDPLDRSTLKQLEFFTGLEVNPVVIPLSQLYEGLLRIDPSFKLHATALTHFLQNHAQSAWVRQKLDNDEVPMPGSERKTRSSPNDVEELYDDMPEIEEIEEIDGMEDVDIEESEADGDEIDPFAGTGASAEDDDFTVEAASGSNQENDDLIEMVEMEETDEESAPLESHSPATDFDTDLSELALASSEKTDGPSESSFDDALATEAATNLAGDFAEETDAPGFESAIETDEAPGFEEESRAVEGEEDFASSLADAHPADDAPAVATAEDADLDFDDPTPQAEPLSTFGFEETQPRALSTSKRSDVLDTLNDHAPSLDVSALASEGLDHELLADLHAETEADDHTPDSDPKRDDGEALAQTSFSDEEETHIDLRSSPAAIETDDDDIQLHPKAEKDRQQSDSGLNPTSALNEMMLRLSLCYTPESVMKILQDALYKIGEAGCFVNTKSQRQILWSEGRLISGDLGPAALLPIVKGASTNRWQALELKASESWSQKPMKLCIFRAGDWLWAHHLKAADDTEIFRETVESTLSQVADKMGAG